MKVMVTGHRPPRLKGKEAEIYEKLHEGLRALVNVEAAHTGMARGADQIFFKAAVNLGIPVICCYPWKNKDMDLIEDSLISQCELIPHNLTRNWLYETYQGKKGYTERDFYMVDNSDIVFAVWDGIEQGGTWNTIKYAREKGKKIIYVEV